MPAEARLMMNTPAGEDIVCHTVISAMEGINFL